MDAGKVLYVRLATNVGRFKGDMAAAAASVNVLGARVESYGERNKAQLRSLGTAAGVMGAAAALGIGVAIKKFADFDKQMSHVQAATQGTKAEMSALRAEALKLGADTQFTASEAAEGIEEMAKAGVKTADILGGGLKGALDLAAAGTMEVAEAAEIGSTAMVQFGLDGKDLPHVADLLAAGAGKAMGDVTDLGAALRQAGLIASNMGLSIEDTTGTLAAFAQAGLVGSDAGTSFKTMIQRLQAPLGRGAKAMEKYGISAYDTQGNFIGITAVAEQLRQKLSHLSQEQRDAALAQIFGADAIRGATVLYRQGASGIQEWIDKTNDAGYANEVAAQKTNNLWGDIERLGGSLDTLFIGMGAGANGPARELVQMLEDIVDVLGSVPGPVLATVTAGLALTAVFGGGVFAATRLIGAVGATRKNVQLLGAQMKLSTAAARTYAASLTFGKVAKGAAILGGIALASSGVADKFGLANTATYALAGSMFGPLGTAAGATVGLLKDLSAASSEAGAAFDEAAQQFADATTFSGQLAALDKMRDRLIQSDNDLGVLADTWAGMETILGRDNIFDDQAKAIAAADKTSAEFGDTLQGLYSSSIGAGDAISRMLSVPEIDRFGSQVLPVLDKAGISIEKLSKAKPGSQVWTDAVNAINQWKSTADTAGGRAEVLEGAMGGLDDQTKLNVDSAKELDAALSGLFNPNMKYDEAVEAWHAALRGLREELGAGNRTLARNTEEGSKNREVIRGSINALKDRMTAAADAGKSEEHIARMMRDGRKAILDNAEAMGFNREKIAELIDYYGLTPELVETLIKTVGADKAEEDINRVLTAADNLSGETVEPSVKPKGTVQAKESLESVGTAADRVGAKNPKPKVGTRGVPSSIEGVNSVGNRLDWLDKKHANPSVHVGGLSGALSGLASLGDMIRNLPAVRNPQAHGGFYPQGLPSFASGAYMTPAHMIRAGRPRAMYGEPETQGESYIPHAMNRRGKSTEILAQTAARFGYDLSPRGMESAMGAKVIVINNGANAPLVGSLTLAANTRAEGRAAMKGIDYEMRRIRRGGRWA